MRIFNVGIEGRKIYFDYGSMKLLGSGGACFNPSTWKAGAGKSLRVQDQLGLQSNFQGSLCCYMKNLVSKQTNKQKNKKNPKQQTKNKPKSKPKTKQTKNQRQNKKTKP